MPSPEDHKQGLRAVTLLFASSLTVMAGAAVSPSLPAIREAFEGVENADLLVRLVLTMPALFIALSAAPAGYLADRWGRKPVILCGTVLYVLAGTSGAYLPGLTTILVGRALLGVAVAGVITATTALIGDYFEGQERDRFMGLQAAFMSFGGVALPLASGVLTDLGWRYPFLIYVVAVFVLPGVWFSIYEPERQREASEHDGIPLHPWSVIGVILGLAVAGMVAFYMIPVQLPFLMKRVVGASGTQAGMALAASSLCGGITSLLFHRIKARIESPHAIVALTFALMGFGFVAYGSATNYELIAVGVVVSGMGLGLLGPNLTIWMLSGTPEHLRGRMVGLTAMCFFIGQFLSPIVARPFIRSGGEQHAFHVFSAALFALSAVFAGYAISRRSSTPREIIS